MPNRLSESASPYLLQHADNPVEWWEWGENAFEEARKRDVPVLVSIGYSACHWCHVMAHESFEDPATAEVMNEGFVNIKVDREERPDVDAVYMQATQAMTGHGGWPMTVFADHDGAPFFTGTYFPAEDRHGMPGFRSVLGAVSDAWTDRRDEVGQQAERLKEAIGQKLPVADDLPDASVLAAAAEALAGQFDDRHGGFGAAPKFPQQPVLEFLLRVHDREWAEPAREMVHRTLAAMAAGGIRDHLGGGFARYSVDERWLVPHFEKMLYDNAQLARLYLWAGLDFDSEPLIEVSRDTLEYLLADLRHTDGGFFSAEDADSEGVEGKFYVWDHDEFMEVTGDDGPVAAAYFGVTPGGNFEGSSILHRPQPLAEIADQHGMDSSTVTKAVRRAAVSLLERRSGRTRPGLDDKVVAAWNGLAIRAFAEAGAALSESRYTQAAEEAAEFVLGRLVDESGRLHRSWAKDRIGPLGVLDDHGAMAMGLFSLYATTGDVRWFHEAMAIVEAIPRLFGDPDGGFFTTGTDSTDLVVRPKEFFDNPLPSGNALAAEALTTASAYTGDQDLWASAAATVRAGAAVLERAPSGGGRLLSVLLTLLEGPRELAIVGPDAADFLAVAWERFRPGLAVAAATQSTTDVPLLADREGDGTRAYVCRRFACERPVSTAEELRARLATR